MVKVGKISENLEDYVERIYDVVRANGVVKISDIARIKGVAMSSVNSAISRLAKEGLAIHDTYKNIYLTDTGAKLAAELDRRHTAVRNFLVDTLGVKSNIADLDACAIEHHLHAETITKIINYMGDKVNHG